MRVLLILMLLAASGSWAYESGRAGFSVRINDEIVPYEVFAVYVLPREALELEAIGSAGPFQIIGDGAVQDLGPRRWSWTAPAHPGLYPVVVSTGADNLKLNVFVMRPASELEDGYLGEFRVGSYPTTPLDGRAAYYAPDGFIELTDATASVQVSPHFRLGQFPAKQAGGYPKYVVLRERLLLKLELLLERLNETGVPAESFTIMSGYRTPYYNAAIGNVPNSRHVYGGAADIFVDERPRDGVMDDINGDGRVDFRDAQRLYQIADRLFARPAHRWLFGGLGVYRRNPAHGPFLHIDARGFRARWGLIP